MAKLEDVSAATRLKGLAPAGVASVESVQWIGEQALKVIFRDGDGQLSERLLYRDDEPSLELVEMGRPWSFDGDGDLLRLVSEAYRINLAWLFDPYVAITTSIIEPLPHQISAVYEEMLPRQPMRFLLADDPGAGKTIMAGLLIKELNVRGDLERCLIVAPGSLTDQWQDELYEKFGLNFEILTTDMIQAARTANPLSASVGISPPAHSWYRTVSAKPPLSLPRDSGGRRNVTVSFSLGGTSFYGSHSLCDNLGELIKLGHDRHEVSGVR